MKWKYQIFDYLFKKKMEMKVFYNIKNIYNFCQTFNLFI